MLDDLLAKKAIDFFQFDICTNFAPLAAQIHGSHQQSNTQSRDENDADQVGPAPPAKLSLKKTEPESEGAAGDGAA